MKVSLIQYDIAWEDADSNLGMLEKLLDNVPSGTDLVVLPEMFTTGFSMNSKALAEKPGGPTSEWLARNVSKRNFAICGSYIVTENDMYFNRFILHTPGMEICIYDKKHLFSIGGEDRSFSKGDSRTICTCKDLRLLPLVCYDLRFPVWIRNRNDYDLIVCVSNWPDARREVWNTLLKARAIENQCFVAGVNRVGSDNSGNSYAGDSQLIGPRGEVIAAAQEYTEEIVTADLDLKFLTDFRSKFPVWKDADDFSLK